MLDQGFVCAVVQDATAGARHPELGDGYQTTLINLGTWSTQCFPRTRS